MAASVLCNNRSKVFLSWGWIRCDQIIKYQVSKGLILTKAMLTCCLPNIEPRSRGLILMLRLKAAINIAEFVSYRHNSSISTNLTFLMKTFYTLRHQASAKTKTGCKRNLKLIPDQLSFEELQKDNLWVSLWLKQCCCSSYVLPT